MRIILNRFWLGIRDSCVRYCNVVPFDLIGMYRRLGGTCYIHILW